MEFGKEFPASQPTGLLSSPSSASSALALPHRGVVLLTFTFRVGALLTYLFCGWFSASFISSFVTIIVLLSMDFWWLKNVSGRKLVGLRWWNTIDPESGESRWRFESRAEDDPTPQSAAESQLFWMALVGFQLLWAAVLLVTLLTFRLNWFVVALIANVMNGSNLYGYVRCRLGDESGSWTSMLYTLLGPQMFRSAFTSLAGLLRPGRIVALGRQSMSI